jgi:hypothetical protein
VGRSLAGQIDGDSLKSSGSPKRGIGIRGMTLLTNFSFAMMPAIISLRTHPGRMAFALGIIVRDKLLALADKVTG